MQILKFLLLLTFIFCAGNLASEETHQGGIEIVYHIGTLNNWQNIVREQLQKIEQSGLGQACDRMTVTVVGPQIVKARQLFENLSFRGKIKIFHAGKDLKKFEFPSIEKVLKIAKEKPHAKILYLHTKGITHFKKPSENPVRYWRRYMEYFAVERWQDCVNALDTYDICGVDYTRSIHGHHFFAGNVWWSRAEYAATCELRRNNRFDCEDFIGRGREHTAKSFHQSGENPKLIDVYPQEKFPQYYFFEPGSPYHQGIMNLYVFSYLNEYYR